MRVSPSLNEKSGNESLSAVSDSLQPNGLISRTEYWSGWPFPFPADLPNPGIQLRSPALQADLLVVVVVVFR